MKRCLLCGASTEKASWRSFFGFPPPPLCATCASSFERIGETACPVCSRPMKQTEPCADCLKWGAHPVFTENRSLYLYNEAMKQWVARFKYRGDYLLAESFAREIRQAAEKELFDFVCPVPLAPSRLAERRFNQSEALILAAGFEPARLIGRHEAEKQSQKGRHARLAAGQTFYPVKEAKGTVLLIDDIYTTGATIRRAAEALGQAGAASVKSITVARTHS